ncbi:MAG: MBOAT family protein [Oscillospiraceae bacterium]|nr:MBOAT family protein [Oscillospiraceae bacterium]
MNFNSVSYMIFLPVIRAGWFMIPAKFRNLYLLAVSYWFYFCNEVRFFLLLPALTAITYAAGVTMEKAINRKAVFLAALGANLGTLIFFKYNRFFLNGISAVTGATFDLTKWLLPMGISFYVFMAVSYLADVYTGKYPAEKSIVKFAAYISFFPHILMGPIDRRDKFIPQLDNDHKFDYNRIRTACQLMAIGFFKKIAVADILAKMIDRVHSNLTDYTGLMLIFIAVMYSFQLYADFSGYSDIARGSAMVLGFDIKDNFRTPYMATSIKDFWRRWHISLSDWFTSYIYFPLGGSRVSRGRHLANLFIVFFVSGIWHGNTWNYVIWGALHGVYRVANQLINSAFPPAEKNSPVKNGAKRLGVFVLVTFSWIFFRAKDLPSAWYYISHMFVDLSPATFFNGLYNAVKTGFDATPLLIYAYIAFNIVSVTVLLILDCIRCFGLKDACLTTVFDKMKPWQRWLCYYGLIALIMAGFIMNNGGYGASASFIYNNY